MTRDDPPATETVDTDRNKVSYRSMGGVSPSVIAPGTDQVTDSTHLGASPSVITSSEIQKGDMGPDVWMTLTWDSVSGNVFSTQYCDHRTQSRLILVAPTDLS